VRADQPFIFFPPQSDPAGEQRFLLTRFLSGGHFDSDGASDDRFGRVPPQRPSSKASNRQQIYFLSRCCLSAFAVFEPFMA